MQSDVLITSIIVHAHGTQLTCILYKHPHVLTTMKHTHNAAVDLSKRNCQGDFVTESLWCCSRYAVETSHKYLPVNISRTSFQLRFEAGMLLLSPQLLPVALLVWTAFKSRVRSYSTTAAVSAQGVVLGTLLPQQVA